MLERAWRELGGDAALPGCVRVVGRVGLPSPLPVGELALAAVGASALAAAELSALRAGAGRRPGSVGPGPVGPGSGPGPVGEVVLDAAHVGLAFTSERFLRVDGRAAAPGFAPLSRFWPSADGWVRVHANYPHHRAALLATLGLDDAAGAGAGDSAVVQDRVGSAIAARTSADVEDAVVAAGGVAAAVRTPAEWAASAAGAAAAASPLVDLHRAGPGSHGPGSQGRAPRLKGLRVLDLTRVIAGPVATRTLASWGADVLRVDAPGRPEEAMTLAETSSGKRCTRLDLADPAGRRAVEDLLAGADVLVHGYRPGALARFGLDGPDLVERFPDLSVVSLSAWGTDGPWASRRGFDSIVQAATGIAVLARAHEDGPPGALPAQALDHGTGHLVAATALRALTSAHLEGGTWHGRLSLAATAHWLLGAERTGPGVGDGSGDGSGAPPDAHLIDLPSTAGQLTVVAPPASPAWTSGLAEVEPAQARWRPRG